MTSLGSPRDIGQRSHESSEAGTTAGLFATGLFATGSPAPNAGVSSRTSPFSPDETHHHDVVSDQPGVDLRHNLWAEAGAPSAFVTDPWSVDAGGAEGAPRSSGRARFGQTSPAIIIVAVITLAVVLTVAGLLLSVWLGPMATDFYSG